MKGSGKTRFKKQKAKGESWTDLRDKAIKNGTFVMPKKEGANK